MRAFSLVELSIVLVILGLLTGGILAGQSLIRASELRSVTMEYQRYAAAVNTFRDKYFAVPGDMLTATRFWGEDAALCDTVAADGVPGTCNGGGNGQINSAGAPNISGEPSQFWKQLALAGLIEGAYSGKSGTSGTGWHCIVGTDCPRAKITNGGWGVAYANTGNAEMYAIDYGNRFLLGAGASGTVPTDPLLRPEEAWNIDTKLDDGKPARGKIIARFWDNACAAADDGSHANNDLEASYRLSDSSIQCSLNFIQQF